MSKAFDYFMDMLMVDYCTYVFSNFGIIIDQPTILFNVDFSKKICDITKLNLNVQNPPIIYTHSHLHFKLLGHVHT
jgi:hypothetical protein